MLLLLGFLASLISIAACHTSEESCSACRAVAKALGERLLLDQMRVDNDLDLRHRLDAEGKRYGKVIDYASSELRAATLLEDLCEDKWIKNYRYDSRTQLWIENSEKEDSLNGKRGEEKADGNDGYALEQQRKALRSYCGEMIGEWEDELMAALMKKTALRTGQDAENFLCVRLGGFCTGNLMDIGSDLKEL